MSEYIKQAEQTAFDNTQTTGNRFFSISDFSKAALAIDAFEDQVVQGGYWLVCTFEIALAYKSALAHGSTIVVSLQYAPLFTVLV